MYKPPKIVTQKNTKYKVKQSKNGKFPYHYKLAQLILKRKFPSKYKPLRKSAPSKRVFEKCKPRGFFSEFYGMIFSRQ